MTKSELTQLIKECMCEYMNEGKMKAIAIDLKDLSDAEFLKKYKKSKKDIVRLLKSKR